MEEQATLQLIEKLASIANSQQMAMCFAAAVQSTYDLTHVFMYICDFEQNVLLPVSSSKSKKLDLMPVISLHEVDNPIIYAIINHDACYVDNVASLVAVGEGFDQLRQNIAFNDSLAAFPLIDQHKKVNSVVVCCGDKKKITAFKNDDTWQSLVKIFTLLFCSVIKLENQSTSAKTQQVYANQIANRKIRKISEQFIESEYVGNSTNAKEVRAAIVKAAPTSLSILLTGETGVGKDYVASLIHKTSSYVHGNFVAVNCAAIPAGLIESELFGNVKGAFTGAHERKGLVASAHQGTLFLDEIGDMPHDMQASLLRLLNEKKYRPVGSTQEHISDFRLICATNKNLPQLIANNKFREDLYYRIRQDIIYIDPLHKRIADLSALSKFFISNFHLNFNKRISGIEDDALQMLSEYNFPGNLRELRNHLFAACEYTAENHYISKQTIALILKKIKQDMQPVHHHETSFKANAEQTEYSKIIDTDDLSATLDDIERRIIQSRLATYKGSRTKTALSLNIPKRTLARKCLNWNL